MKKIFFLTAYCLCFVANNSFGQTDKFWKLGYFTGLDFKTLPPQIILDTSTACMDNSSTCISDLKGNLLLFTNGFKIFNKNGNVIQNGNGFNSGTLSTPYYNNGGCYPLTKCSIILPFPNDTNKFYLFYENMEWAIEGNKYPDKLRFLVVDKSMNGGLGNVLFKDSILIQNDTLADGNIFSFKHGNGKDYWLIARKNRSNKFYTFLIDSLGIHRQPDQFIGNAYLQQFQAMGVGNINVTNDKVAYEFTSFNSTPNIHPGQIDLYDFDRCKGVLYNYKQIYIDNLMDTLNASSVCFSPSNRFLYVSDNIKMWQLDLQATNILQSRIMVGARLTGNNYNFWEMKNGIDGKIYIGNAGSGKYLHVINAPDSFGLACNFIQKQIQIPSTGFYYSNGGLPNEPNFALGKINCTTGMEELATKNEAINIYPNPATNQLTVVSNQLAGNTIEVLDVLGRVILKSKAFAANCQLNTTNLQSGFYFLKITDEKGNSSTKKFVKE